MAPVYFAPVYFLTETGLKPIGNIESGEKVFAQNFTSGKWDLQLVTERLDNIYEGDVLTIEAGGDEIETTIHHPFWVVEGEDLAGRPIPRELSPDEDEGRSVIGRWVDSHELRVGDVLLNKAGERTPVTAISKRQEDRFEVTNLTIADAHNYAVGNGSLLVHNTSICSETISDASKRLEDTHIDDVEDAFRNAAKQKDVPELEIDRAWEAAFNKFAGSINMSGCFDGDTPCLVSKPAVSSSDTTAVSSRQVGTAIAITNATATHQSETSIPIKDVPLGARISAQNPHKNESYYHPANEGMTGWKQVSIEARHSNGSVVDMEILRSPEWIEQNSLRVGEWFSFDLTDIDIDGRGFVRAITNAADIAPGDGAVVIGRFATREVTNRVRVTLADGTSLTGTANHPVWCEEHDDWISLGDLKAGLNMRSRQGPVEVAAIEPLTEAAPVYNLEVAGEHVYEITELGVLVHNSSWDCGEFLRLQEIVRAGSKADLSPDDLAKYEGLLNMVKNKFRRELGDAEIETLVNAAPDDLLAAGGHLHHILPKLGREQHRDQILALQTKLWNDHGIDPFMSLDNFVFAPTTGVHTNVAMDYVIGALENFLKKGPEPHEVRAELARLGAEAQEGFPDLL